MRRFLAWLDDIPWWVLLIAAAALGSAPVVPQPHLAEKIGMLLEGSLRRPIDIFDLFMHGIFPVLLVWKLVRLARGKGGGSGTGT